MDTNVSFRQSRLHLAHLLSNIEMLYFVIYFVQ
jgi:hypothetical protein